MRYLFQQITQQISKQRTVCLLVSICVIHIEQIIPTIKVY